MWHGCCYKKGWSKYFRNCCSAGIFTEIDEQRLIQQRNVPLSGSCVDKNVDVRGQSRMGILVGMMDNDNSNSRLLQPRYAQYHLTLNLDADGQHKTTLGATPVS